MTASIY